MNFEHLKTMSREQLLETAGKMGLQVHHKSKNETIIKVIMDKALNPVKKEADPYAEPRLQAKEAVFNTREQVEEAVAPIKAQRPEFTTTYNDEEKTVKFSCRGAEETLNMSTSLRTMRKIADQVKYGRRSLMGHDSFDKGNAGGKSAYTNVVLAG